ncbi:MAG: hypothetical protein IKO10_16500 [Lachnospiraceae bacterium]|nr:hypothetical protein [Lachnospiraceae bacterium]
MGEWYYYNVYFNDQDQHLVSRLCRDGYAEVVCNRDTNGREDQTIKLFLDKIDLATKDNPEIKRRVEKSQEGDEQYAIEDGYYTRNYYRTVAGDRSDWVNLHFSGEDKIQYVNKWVPNYAISIALSALYPNDVIKVAECPPRRTNMVSYMKDGDYCNREGEKCLTGIWYPSQNLIKETKDDKIRIILPIGEGNDKWGSVWVPLKNMVYDDPQSDSRSCCAILFTEEPIQVAFRSGTLAMSAAEFEQKYYESKDNYRYYINETMFLRGVQSCDMRERGSGFNRYYIVDIRVPESVSQSGVMLITCPDAGLTRTENGCDIPLGGRIKERRCRVVKNGQPETIFMKHEKIKELYDDSLQMGIPGIENEEIEDDERDI